MPTATVRQEFRAYLEVQLETAKSLGLDDGGLPISSDAIESLFGVAKRHGVGQTQDVRHRPALAGLLVGRRLGKKRKRPAIPVARQRERTAEFIR